MAAFKDCKMTYLSGEDDQKLKANLLAEAAYWFMVIMRSLFLAISGKSFFMNFVN